MTTRMRFAAMIGSNAEFQKLWRRNINKKGLKKMKKLFISCPMRGRTPEAIKKSIEKMHKIAEATVGEELEVIPSYKPDSEYKNKPIACLGESIKRMQDADFFVCIDESYRFRGCESEKDIAVRYGIPSIVTKLAFVAPDVFEKESQKTIF